MALMSRLRIRVNSTFTRLRIDPEILVSSRAPPARASIHDPSFRIASNRAVARGNSLNVDLGDGLRDRRYGRLGVEVW